MKIAFYTPDLNFRGTCVAIVSYATYNEKILGNKSIIMTHGITSDTTNIAKEYIENLFSIIYIKEKNVTSLILDNILSSNNCDLLYCIKYGKNDGIYSNKVKTIVHCVFDMSEKHGDVYIAVSKSLANKYNSNLYLPHIVDMKNDSVQDLRSELSIPLDVIVIGRYGGIDTFNVEFVKQYISDIVRRNNNIYFLFMNCSIWDNHKQIINLEPTVSIEFKQRFISTCDAMIVPESLGHTFGLSIAEFTVYNKSIICFNDGKLWNDNHVKELKNEAIYFSNILELAVIIENFNIFKNIKPFNAYKQYSPNNVMNIFYNKCIK